MPKYFFETFQNGNVYREPEGVELPDDLAAKRMAWGSVADLITEIGQPTDAPLAVKVVDAMGRAIYVATATGSVSSEW